MAKKGSPPPHIPTHEEASKAGKASGEARRKKKSMQSCTQKILAMKASLLNSELIDAIKYIDETMTVNDAIIVQQVVKAIVHSDTTAATFVRDTSGQKPTDKLDVEGKISYTDALKKLVGPEM